MNVDPSDVANRDMLVASLKQFPLSYEQYQLLHAGKFGMLVPDVRKAHRRFTLVLYVLVVAFASELKAFV